MKKKLLIIGASGQGKVVADIARRMDKWEYIGFLDDNKNIKTSMGIDVIGNTTEAFKYLKEFDIFVGIGSNGIREKIQECLEGAGASIPTLIHPRSIIGEEVEIGSGSVVMAGVVINCCTKIGKGCIINTGATIDHDNHIGKYVHISPGAHLAGMVRVGTGTWLGIGSSVSNNVSIVGECKIGAGAVVIGDIKIQGTYVGVPSKKIN
jgi:sugar O-acyltransferase (sialic acid O-acetyltransferase NeuD family)